VWLEFWAKAFPLGFFRFAKAGKRGNPSCSLVWIVETGKSLIIPKEEKKRRGGGHNVPNRKG